jgi:type I restriction enzyme S subunit
MTIEEADLPEGWRVVATGDVARVIGGGTPKTSVPGNFSQAGGHPWITPADLTGYSEKYISRGRRNLTDQGLKTSSAKYMPAGTVLFSSRAPIGYVAIAACPVTTNQGFRSFVPSDEVDPEYLYYALKLLRPDAEQLASGTTFAELSGSKAKTLQFPLAPRQMQHQLVSVLDQTARSTSNALSHLAMARLVVDRFRQAVLASAASGRLTQDWRVLHPLVNSEGLVDDLASLRRTVTPKVPKEIADDDLPEIPLTWKWMSVDAVASLVVDGVHKTPTYVDSGIPFVTVRNLTAGPGLSFDRCRYISVEDHRMFTKRTRPQRGDILISKDGTLGVTRSVRTDEEFSIFVSVALVKPLDYRMSDFLEIALSSPQVQRQMVGVGSGLQHLVLRDLKGDGVPIPPLDEQIEIVTRVNCLLDLCDVIQRIINSSEEVVARTSRSVLGKVFRGDLVLPIAAEAVGA